MRVRLIEIGEAVKSTDAETLALMPEIPWSDVARMRVHLAHRYFDTTHAIVRGTVENDLPAVEAAVRRVLEDTGD
ncbi:MAG: HepT-like ribonuclease domain-containing protein [Geodermatophilaceae bacterium]